MDTFRSAFDQHAAVLWVSLAIAVVLLAIWLLRVHLRSRRTESRIEGVLSDLSEGNTAHQLTEYLAFVRSTAGTVRQVKEEHDRLARIVPSAVQRVGLVRFSPFHDTGGDQSFTLALLDGRGDGVVLTALHSRTDSRLYAKPIESGSSAYSLTPEEREAMDQAFGRSREASRA